MADYWAENLQLASFDGVAFPVRTLERSGGRAKVRHRYPYRDAQDVEDTGREPYAWTIEIPLFAGMSPVDVGRPLYPDTYELLRFLFDDPDTLGEAEYVDPELGPFDVAVISHTWRANADARNGGVYTLQIEEVSADPFPYSITEGSGSRSSAEQAAADADLAIVGVVTEDEIAQAWEDDGVAVEDGSFDPGAIFTGLVDDFFNTIQDASLAADDVAAYVDRVRYRIDRVLRFDAMREASRWSIVASLNRLSDTLTQAGEEAQASRPTIVDFVVPWVMSADEVALQLYGDVSRAEEIVRRNPTRDPNAYQTGRVLKVQSE